MESSPSTKAIILAAGLGTRMKSSVPKALHQIGGRPMVDYVIQAVQGATDTMPMVVYSSATLGLKQHLGSSVQYAHQVEPRGTGDALRSAFELITPDVSDVVVAYGDTPLIRQRTVEQLLRVRQERSAALVLAAIHRLDPTGYGRIILDDAGCVIRIVEEKDATAVEKRQQLVNAGLYVFEREWLATAIHRLQPSPHTGEFYLTDLVFLAHLDGRFACAVRIEDATEFQGVNTPEDLRLAEEMLSHRIASKNSLIHK